MSQSFFKLDKSWYDGELWTIPGDYQNMCFCDSELLKNASLWPPIISEI